MSFRERRTPPKATAPRVLLTAVAALILCAAAAPLLAPAADPPAGTFWAFSNLASHVPPAPNDRARVRTPVDAFVLAKLESQGLTFSPDASRATLLRRAHLDLLGLPPAPEEV